MACALRELLLAAIVLTPLVAVLFLPITAALLIGRGNIAVLAVGVLLGVGWAWTVWRAFRALIRDRKRDR